MGKKMEKKKAELPPARAGILSFWDEEAPGIKIDPDHVLYACFVVAVLLIIAHAMTAV
ncbi:preprotein translocase subunit Sec61beta [Methanopyrus sp.]